MVGQTSSQIEHVDPIEDDPQQRKPIIDRAMKELNWKPVVPLKIGLEKTIDYFRKELQRSSHSERNIFDPHSHYCSNSNNNLDSVLMGSKSHNNNCKDKAAVVDSTN